MVPRAGRSRDRRSRLSYSRTIVFRVFGHVFGIGVSHSPIATIMNPDRARSAPPRPVAAELMSSTCIRGGLVARSAPDPAQKHRGLPRP